MTQPADPTLEHLYDATLVSSPAKTTWYDWNGANEAIFKAIHSIQGDEYYHLMLKITHMGNRHNLPIYIVFILMYVLGGYMIRKIRGSGGNKHFLAMWVGILAVIAISYGINGFVIGHLKDYFAYPRPYMVIEGVEGMDRKDDGTDNYHSFPSGHVTFATLMVFSMWSGLSGIMRVIGVGFIFAVAWSRIALGMHFPADLLGAFLISLTVAFIVRRIVHPLMHKIFGLYI